MLYQFLVHKNSHQGWLGIDNIGISFHSYQPVRNILKRVIFGGEMGLTAIVNAMSDW
jgi:hypothetical protein